ncbi:MAG: M24 family metallopeptidase [Planctomycetota bacterium]|jgi:Xaa-Pro aminopeptidase
MTQTATIRAGTTTTNLWLYRVAPMSIGDACAFIELPDNTSTFIVRDIESDRARKAGFADTVLSPPDIVGDDLHPDRDIATAIATAQFLKSKGLSEITTDRSLPMLFAHEIEKQGISVHCDPMLGVDERRSKSEREIEALKQIQKITEDSIAHVCRLIAQSNPDSKGVLHHDGAPLTSARVRTFIDLFHVEHSVEPSGTSIVACGTQGGDCHNRGEGELKTGQPIIIDVFPRHAQSRYYGDCTRTMVHGDIPDNIAHWHSVVCEAKAAAIGVTRAGVTAHDVHMATMEIMHKHGFERGINLNDPDYVSIQHGTGHGVGLDVHEPPLLDENGPELLAGECLTIEPGLYATGVGGVRVEDMVIVRQNGCENLNSIQEGLSWS